MSKRLQVVFEEHEYREIQQIARAHRLTLAEWVRQTLRAARRLEPVTDTGKKLAAIRNATLHSFPTADIDKMLGEIERGYLSPRSE